MLSGCDFTDREEVTFVEIKPGVGIEDLKFGMSAEEVLDITGSPDITGLGDFPGNYFRYTSGLYAGVALIAMDDEGVNWFQLTSEFEGRSADGIGINSERKEVVRHLGEPAQTITNDLGVLIETYQYDETAFILSYAGNKVFSITLDR